MKPQAAWSVIGAAAVMAGCASHEAVARRDEDLPGKTLSEPELRLRAPQTADLGAPILLNIHLQNRGAGSAYWHKMDGFQEFNIIVKPAGEGLPLSPTVPAGSHAVRAEFMELPAGEMAKWQVDLAKSFDWKPGRYVISVTMDISFPSTAWFPSIRTQRWLQFTDQPNTPWGEVVAEREITIAQK